MTTTLVTPLVMISFKTKGQAHLGLMEMVVMVRMVTVMVMSTQPHPDPVDIDQSSQDALLAVARDALPLHALAPTSTWNKEQLEAWERALSDFAARIAPALDTGGDAVVNLVHDFLRLPATILVPYIENASKHNPYLGTFLAELASDGNPLVLAEENCAEARRVHAATKQLR